MVIGDQMKTDVANSCHAEPRLKSSLDHSVDSDQDPAIWTQNNNASLELRKTSVKY